MIFTSSSVTSFQNHRLREKSIQNASLAADVCSVRMLTFPPRVSPPFPLQREGTETRKRGSSLTTEGRVGSVCMCVWGGRLDIVLDVYKLLVLAGRMHYCLVRDANL